MKFISCEVKKGTSKKNGKSYTALIFHMLACDGAQVVDLWTFPAPWELEKLGLGANSEAEEIPLTD